MIFEHRPHGFAVRRAAGAISRFFQIVDNQFPNIAVVIDDQDVVNTLQRLLLRQN